MSCSCSPKNDDFQPPPTSGPLKENLNLPFARLLRVLDGDDGDAVMRLYVVKSIKGDDNGRMVQRGSGPNIMGGAITLCTCKHWMRTYDSPEEWKGKWIIGISGVNGNPRRAVFYMMKVKEAFPSHLDLWRSSQVLSAGARKVKAANEHRLGDLFEPKDDNGDAQDPANYVKPIDGHSHDSEWHRDICYSGVSGRPPALLVGDPGRSFVWTKPMLFPRFETWEKVRQKKGRLEDFPDWFGAEDDAQP